MFYLALSCLQGLASKEVLETYIELQKETIKFGIQLTGGNIPYLNLQEDLERNNIPHKVHHNFDWNTKLVPVWNNEGKLLKFDSDSIHPPFKNKVKDQDFWNNSVNDCIENNIALEIMYKEYFLGNTNEINRILDTNIPIALDVSHLNLMRVQKLIDSDTINRLLNYSNISEIHVSHNQGYRDSHELMNKDTYLLDWAKERKDIPLVLECYFHKLTKEQRIQQINMCL